MGIHILLCSGDAVVAKQKGEAMKQKKLGLEFIWKIRLRLYAEGKKLRIEGERLRVKSKKLHAKANKLWKGDEFCVEGSKLQAEGDEFCAEGDRLCAKSNKLCAEGDRLWIKAILEVYGNIKLEWIWRVEKENYACKLETGEIFEP